MKGKTVVDKLVKHFDEDWKTQRSTIRQTNEEIERLKYNPTSSWEAKSDNPRHFSRLDQTVEVAVQTTRPIALLNSAVLILEKPEGMSVYGREKMTNSSIPIPLTLEQRDIGMVSGNLSGDIPLTKELKDDKKVIVMEKGPCFQNMQVKGPVFKIEEKPEFYVHYTSQEDARILKPSEQKTLLDFEMRKRSGEYYTKKASTDRQHTKAIFTNPFHSRGVLGVDSADNPNSEVYGQQAQVLMERAEVTATAAEKKKHVLAERGKSMTAVGNLLVPDTISSSVREKPLMPRKGGDHHSFTYEETRDRIFKKTEIPFDPIRGQYLRDQDLYGKNHNIITHHAIEHWPSQVLPRINKTMDHPSQQSLDSHRNLQGSLNTRKYL